MCAWCIVMGKAIYMPAFFPHPLRWIDLITYVGRFTKRANLKNLDNFFVGFDCGKIEFTT